MQPYITEKAADQKFIAGKLNYLRRGHKLAGLDVYGSTCENRHNFKVRLKSGSRQACTIASSCFLHRQSIFGSVSAYSFYADCSPICSSDASEANDAMHAFLFACELLLADAFDLHARTVCTFFFVPTRPQVHVIRLGPPTRQRCIFVAAAAAAQVARIVLIR